MKYQVYFVTLFCYITIHAMRMTIPFVSNHLTQFFGLDNSTLGLANSAIYILLGFGYLYQVVRPTQPMKRTYLIFVSISAVSYALIAIYSFLGFNSPVLLIISLAFYGLFQCNTWSTVLYMIKQYFTSSQDGCVLGIWSSNSELGNIFGFIVATVIIFVLGWAWQIALLLSAFLAIVMAIFLSRLPVQNPDISVENRKEQFYKLLHCLKNPLPLYIIIEICILKSLSYGVLLWFPMYMIMNNLKAFSGLISISYSVSAIIGATSLGSLYQLIQSPTKRHFVFVILSFVLILVLWIMKSTVISVQNQQFLLLYLGIIGFCISGKYCNIMGNQSLIFCAENNIQVYIWGSFIEATSFTSIGIFQIIIGLFSTSNAESLFFIFLIIGIVCLIFQLMFFIYLWTKNVQTDHSLANKQNQDNQIGQIIQQ